jgi:mannose-1-phosphate guanylyltransferase
LAEAGKLVTFLLWNSAEGTSYGLWLDKKDDEVSGGYLVDKSIEKPSSDVAQEYLDLGDYIQKSWMFLFKASRYLEELQKFRPDIADACEASTDRVKPDLDFLRINKESFIKCPSDSVDYVVMEKTADAVVVPTAAGWSDIGLSTSVWDIRKKDKNGNVSYGDVIQHGTNNSFVRADGKLVATVGVDDLIIVSTKDALMVARKDSDQDIKIIAQKIKNEKHDELDLNREVYRSLGKYDSIDAGER